MEVMLCEALISLDQFVLTYTTVWSPLACLPDVAMLHMHTVQTAYQPLVTPTSAAQPSDLATADAHFVGDLATPTTRLATPITQPDTPPCVQPTSSTNAATSN